MATESVLLTIQDLRDSCWKEAIAQSEKKDCSHYHSLFLARFRQAEESSNQKQQNVFRLLTDITSLFMRSDNCKEPYGPMAVMDGKRSAIIDDFSEEQLNILKEFIPEIDDPELRARISDVIWLRQRDYKVAEIAIDSYLETALRLEDPDHWPSCFDRIERAFRLAASLGDSNGKFDKVVAHIENMLEKYDGNDPLYLSEKLMGLLCESKEGDPVKYSQLTEKLATNAEKAHDWQRAQTHWLRKAEWDRIGKNEEARKSSLISAAETYVKLAEGSISGERKSYMVASSHLTKAIEAYRRIGGMKDRIDELHSILLTYEKESLKEFGVISAPPMDLSKAIEGARESVKGKCVIDSLFVFSQNFRIETVDNLKKRIQDHIKIAPLSYMMSGVIVNEKGKVVGKKPGLLLEDKDEQELGLRPHMFQEAKMGYWIDVQALIDPMRRQINLEHYVTVNDLALKLLVTTNVVHIHTLEGLPTFARWKQAGTLCPLLGFLSIDSRPTFYPTSLWRGLPDC